MKSPNTKAKVVRLWLLAVACASSTVAAVAQVSQDQRDAIEEAERQRQIARIYEANVRQLIAYSIDGRELGAIGEPELYNFPQFSPDLSMVAAVRFDLQEESADLWILDAETGEARRVTFSQPRERIQTPAWSPDGSEIAYVALRDSYFGIYRQDARGEGEPELLYRHEGGPIVLADWSLDGRLLAFSVSDLSGGRLYVLPLDGDVEPVLVAQSNHMMAGPRFSPDGRYLSYTSDETGRNELYVTAATPSPDGSGDRWQLTKNGGFGIGMWHSAGGRFYYLGPERRVMEIDVDTTDGFRFGEERHVFTVPDAVPAGGGGGLVTMSRNGERLIFALPPRPDLLRIAVLDREGKVLSRLGEPNRYSQPSFSPDESKVAALRQDERTGQIDIWIFDVESGQGHPLTTTVEINEAAPVWMADGEHVAYSYFHEDHSWIYRKAVDGESPAEPLFRYTAGAFITLMDGSTDDEFLTFESFGFAVTVRLTGDDPLAREPVDLLREEFEVSAPRFSPDLRYLAYTYNSSGRPEVYLTAFDASTGMAADAERVQVSDGGTIGGISWRNDGRELYYISEILETPELNDVRVMAVEIETTPTLRAGVPRALFELTLPTAGDPSQWQNASRDGQRFLFALPETTGGSPAGGQRASSN